MNANGEKQRRDRPLLDRFKEEIYRDLIQGPSQVDVERQRLLSRIDETKEPREIALRIPVRVFAFGGGVVIAVFLLVFIFQKQDPQVEQPILTDKSFAAESAGVEETPSFFSTAQGSGDKVVLKDKSVLWLGPSTEIAVQEEGRPVIRMNRGRMLLDVSVKPSDLKVTTPHLEISVHGTTFSVRVSAETSLVRLHKGEIELVFEGGKTVMRQGNEIEVSLGKAPKTRPITEEGAMADLMISQMAGESTDLMPGKTIQEETKRISVPKPLATDQSEPTNKNDPFSPQFQSAESSSPLFILDDFKIERAAEEDSEKIDSGQDDGQSLPTVDRDTRSVSFEKGGSALDSAFFGRVRGLTKSGACDRAINEANSYLESFPNGAHREDVLYFMAFCEARFGNLKKSRELFESYLSSYPNGRYWKRISEILGN